MAGYKTLIFSFVTLLLTALDLFINDGTMLQVIFGTPEHAAAALVVLKLMVLVLRWYTTTPMFTSPEEVEAQVIEKIVSEKTGDSEKLG